MNIFTGGEICASLAVLSLLALGAVALWSGDGASIAGALVMVPLAIVAILRER